MEYLLKSSAILFIFYLFYKLFLQNETFFKTIRFYLLTGLIASLVLPLIIIPKYITTESVKIPVNMSELQRNNSIPTDSFPWQDILIVLYFAGVVFFIFRFLIRLYSVIHFINTHKHHRFNHFNLIKTQKDISPFSFFNFIVYNEANYTKKELEQILSHEKVHVNQFHSFDNLLSQIISIVLWFNPFSWLYNKEIQKNLEFIADEEAQNIANEKKNYQYLLLKTSAPKIQPVLTSNFHNSLIKKRINMLQKERSGKLMQLKFTLILPVLIAFIYTFNTKVIAQQKNRYTFKITTDRVDYYEIITKDTKNFELKNMKENFAKNGTQFKYNKLKRNKKGEITSISITIKNKAGNHAKLSQHSDNPISAIRINDNIDTGELSVGNFNDKERKTTTVNTVHSNAFSTDNNGDMQVYFIQGDSIKTSNNSNLIILNDQDGIKKKYILTVKSENQNMMNSDDKNMKVLISTNGDTTQIKNVNIIKTGDRDHLKIYANEVVLEKGSLSKDGNLFIFKSDDKINASNRKNNMMVYKSSGKTPLFYLDGRKISEKEMKEINPDNIGSISVLKGEMAIKKYGTNGKDGVIEISTKNDDTPVTDPDNIKPLIIIDGKEIKNRSIEDIDADSVESINVLKGKTAIEKYGQKGSNGVVEIKTKK